MVLVAAIIIMMGFFLAAAIARPVNAEDDCAIDTLVVKRVAGVLWCIGEPGP